MDLEREVRTSYILHWNYRGYSVFPPELLSHGQNVEEIYYKENQLENIPDEIDKCLLTLKNLYLHGNYLETLPSTIGNMEFLTVLEISRNALKKLPDEIGGLKNLETLDLANNYLKDLPNSIGDLHNLQYLILMRNELVSIPKTVGKLKCLISLHLSGNQITHLPEEIGDCTNLVDLYVGGNQLRRLPKSLTNLPNLSHACLSSNRLEVLPLLPFISSPKIYHDYCPELQHIPFIFGCQQSITSYISMSSMRMQLLQSSPRAKWHFSSLGCFRFLPKGSNDSQCLHFKFENENLQQIVPIRIGQEFRDFVIYSINEPRIEPCQQTFKLPSLQELSLRKLHFLMYGITMKARLLGNLSEVVYVRSKEQIRCQYSFLSTSNILPFTLYNQLVKNGPTTFCCNPNCLKPIFEYCCLGISEVRMTSPEVQPQDLIKDLPYLTSVYFCGPWCIRNFLNDASDICLTVKELIFNKEFKITPIV